MRYFHSTLLPGVLTIVAGLVSGAFAAVVAADPGQLARGAEVFQANCAVCHGPAGQPDPDSELVKSLGVVPANFSDPLFNSREPLSDWNLVVNHGGPVLGFSEKMPAFGETLAAEDVEAVLAYVKTLGGAHDYPDGELNLFLPLRTRKAFPEDEWVWQQRYTDREGDNQWRNLLEYEWRIGERWQGVMEVLHVVEGDSSELEAAEPGFKYVLFHDPARGSIFTLGGNVVVPFHADGEWELLPYLAWGRLLSDTWTFQGSTLLKLSLEDSDHSSAEFAGVVHWVHTSKPRSVFPALELVGEVPFERGTGASEKSAVQWSVIPQARIGLNKRGHVALHAGVELPVNDRERYEWRAYAYLIWDFADGGFFEGW